MIRLALVASLFFGCTKPAPPPSTEPAPAPTNPAPAPDPAPTPPPADPGSASPPAGGGPGIAEKCGDNDACAAGLECVKYYGVAGARGPQFKSCEKRCKGDADCMAGKTCRRIADGPGEVCR